MFVARLVVKILFYIGIYNIGAKAEREPLQHVPNPVAVIGVGKRSIGKEFWAKSMVPTRSSGAIAPIEQEIKILIIKSKHIAAKIATQEQSVFFGKLKIDFGV